MSCIKRGLNKAQADRMNKSSQRNPGRTSYLSLVVVQIKVLSVLLLPVSPPPLGGSTSLRPSAAQSVLISFTGAPDQRPFQKEQKGSVIFTCWWWAPWRARPTAGAGRSPARSGPDRSSCRAGGGAGRCGRSSPPSSQ